MFNLYGPEGKRKRLLKKSPAGPLKNYLQHPLPKQDLLLSQASLLAVDFETTGLSPKKNNIISIGCVQIDQLIIDLASAHHRLINANSPLPQESVVIHKITDDQHLSGVSIQVALDEFLYNLKGRILLAHHAKIEAHFLNETCKRIYGSEIQIPVIDTLELELRKLAEHEKGNNNLNLSVCCKRYNLPRYRLHDALSDAISCGELMLAQVACSEHRLAMRVGQLVKYLP